MEKVIRDEFWKDVKGYEGYYHVSNMGRVKSLTRLSFNNKKLNEKILSYSYETNEYITITLSKKGCSKVTRIHRLVAEAFIPNPENKPQVNHINGIKTDNRVENLEWVTALENIQHSLKNNLKTPRGAIGVKNRAAKLNETQVIEIFNMVMSKLYTQSTIANIYGIDRTQVSSIKLGKTWKHLNLVEN